MSSFTALGIGSGRIQRQGRTTRIQNDEEFCTSKWGCGQTMMLLLSIALGLIPLLGVAWTVVKGTITTVDGLFLSLILLALSAVFFLNAVLELRANKNESLKGKVQKAS